MGRVATKSPRDGRWGQLGNSAKAPTAVVPIWLCRSLRSPHEATWSPHVGTHQPEHALHIVRKTTVEAKLRSQFRGFLGSQNAICFSPTTRQPGECQLVQMTTKSKSSNPALTWEASPHLNHPFPTPESLSARWAASGGPAQKESTTPNTLISSKLVPNWIHQLHLSSRREIIIIMINIGGLARWLSD